MYTDESFRIKTTRKYGKTERRIVKDHRTPSQVNVKEREGYKMPVVNPGTSGEIEGQPVGTRYVYRALLLEAGMHGSIRRGIYSFGGIARSVVLSDGYEEFNKDKGNKIRLCGEGGRSKDGKMQVKDQEYTCGNKALQNAMRSGEPIRVIRGYKLNSKYAPRNGFRYDGLYIVIGCYEIRDGIGYRIILFKLERLPGQLPIGTCGAFWFYPEAEASSSMTSHTFPLDRQQISVN
ncbi:PUA-like domain-containing protein [Armillaria novae-zelandiae]|uniref:PUA-like domain-containing protein n=1 Tax=Armillaria novae-zelandiae TaxID=153914 RepID=A0AA39NWE3_9AGAR|nr:PUA-like domain-containing protein [Armillaria novae-zelandiae]